VSAHVAAMLVTPIKGLRVSGRDEVVVGPAGVEDNRRFLLLDTAGRMVNGKRLGALQALTADFSPPHERLAIHFPDGTVVSGEPLPGAPATARFFSSAMAVREIAGPWSAALSEFLGEQVTLVRSELDAGAVDRGASGAVSLISQATLARVAAAAGVQALDARRFRMLFEVDGVGAHEEDDWLGVPLRIGEAVVTPNGHVGRCLVTTLDPDSGVRDIATLDALAVYREGTATTEPLACGIYGRVEQPGVVRVGDAVTPA
jgi:uncharacterized protein YcbX